MKQAMMFAAIAVVTLVVQANPTIVGRDDGVSQSALSGIPPCFCTGDAD